MTYRPIRFRAPLACVTLLAASLAGCAALANTPAQDRTTEAAERCRGLLPADGVITRIEPDGKIWVAGSTGTGNFNPFFSCVRNGGPR
jgi:hypothetical protein